MTKEMAQPGQTKTATSQWPVWLSLIAGLLILIDGIILVIAGPVLLVLGEGAATLVLGLGGVVFGIIVLWAAYSLQNNAGSHVLYSAIIVLFSIIALVLTGGGFIIGSILGIIGGIWALFAR
jgi:hypothetical protein